jgi:hypothetical protein
MFTSHTGYTRESQYEIFEHKYVGGDDPPCGGFMDLLEIKNPPNGRCGVIIQQYSQHCDSREIRFTEWQSLEEALAAFEQWWGWSDPFSRFAKMPGFLRRVDCGQQTPWFHAKPEEYAPGDYVAPPGYLF